MTDTVGDVIVTGQRRPAGSSEPFPKDEPVIVNGPVDPNDATIGEESTTVQEQQCAIPKNRKIWDADARAAQGVKDFMTYSAGQNIFGREHQAYIRFNGTQMELGNISVGPVPQPGQTPYVSPNITGITGANWMGDVHTHVSTIGQPSQEDINDFNMWYDQAVAAGRTDLADVAMYIAVRDSSAPDGYRIYAYTKTSDPNVNGREVDPNGQPCPA
ncbi:hypothetical protein [Brevundimonas goettingensis]|jgi:hypothetical protein|uniref:Uncharacterized protein n=1 Tax=Brevundimonas goettingensis TaxID=2774190 RepID=A0A975C2Q0_9CAUL|nr:hypothetical protein [Brevundimonas goettingensis]QTC90472.1 hypothetical protein IFJ75_14475 [Brevundimonas goettingensis]